MKLKPLKPGEEAKEEKFFVCDIETMKWTKFLAIGLYDGVEYLEFFVKSPLSKNQVSRGLKERGCRNPLREFLAHLFSLGEKKITVYAHFGGLFDFAFILEEAFQIPGIHVESLIPRGSGLLCFDLVEYDGEGKVKTKIHFSDSAALLPFGLKSLTENFGVDHNKLDWDHNKTDGVSFKLLEYLKVDCMGLYEVISKFRSWPLIQSAGAKSTMASQAIQVLRLYLKSSIRSIPAQISKKEGVSPDKFVRDSYVGGRTEVFKPFAKPGTEIFCADVNSLYPYIMRTTEMPSRVLEFTKYYDPNSHGFYDAVIEVPRGMYIPPLGTLSWVRGRRYNFKKERWENTLGQKFIFPTGIVRGRWTTIEIEYAKSLGCKVLKTGRGLKFSNGGKLFGPYIDDLYQIRLNSPGESVDNILAKLLMNSCYGRTGLQRVRTNLVIDDGANGREEYAELNLPRGRVKLMLEPNYLGNTFSNVAIAAWVTAASRIHMHKIYMNHVNEIYYTDTDSLFITRKLKDSKELGDLKIEYSSNGGACFLLPKTYCVDGIYDKFTKSGKPITKKIVMKGFDKKAAGALNLEDFKYALEGDIHRLKAVMPPKFSTFKTALRHGKLVTMNPEYTRRVVSQYDKRKVIKTAQGDYDTLPLELFGGEAEKAFQEQTAKALAGNWEE